MPVKTSIREIPNRSLDFIGKEIAFFMAVGNREENQKIEYEFNLIFMNTIVNVY
jgi:hypothetical protein